MSNRHYPLLIAFSSLMVAACSAPDKPDLAMPEPLSSTNWSFDLSAPALRSASCPDGISREEPQSLALEVLPVVLGQDDAVAGRLPPQAKLAGAWQLSSTDRNLGGLSGLAIIEGEDRLIAVSDAGALVSIPLADGTPQTAASIVYLRGADGRFLGGKIESDAEGLVYRDGLALVSFERRFRIEAFAVGACGGAARAALVAPLPGSIDGKAIGENAGPEALSLAPNGSLAFGYENAGDGTSPIGIVASNGAADWTGENAGNPAGYALVGFDDVAGSDGEVTRFTLFRSFDPVRGVRTVLAWGESDTERLTLTRPILTDNFEGIAAEPLATGGFRVWIVSDDNFSKAQKTLLYALEVDPAG